MTDALSEAPAYGIARLLQEGRFIVPSHQRDFAWGDDDVKQLFDDVTDALGKKSDSYFLGLLVFLFSGSAYTILDGQQRLATTVIIFAAIRDWLRQYPQFLQDATKIQDWYIGGSELGQSEPTPKVILNQTNNQFFVDFVVKGAAFEDVLAAHRKLKRNDPNRLLLEAVIYAHGRVKEIAQSIGDSGKTAKHFFDFVTYFRDNIRTVRLIAKDENAAYPSDPDFEAAFALKTERTNQKAQYFLRALEQEEQRLAKGKMAGEWEPSVLTVEHILPKKPGVDWKPILATDPEIVEDCVARLGNMCLLTKINEKLGNKGFATKRTTFAQSELLTTKTVAASTIWNRKAIERRQTHLAGLARSIWRYA
jgi:hypothetical protein